MLDSRREWCCEFYTLTVSPRSSLRIVLTQSYLSLGRSAIDTNRLDVNRAIVGRELEVQSNGDAGIAVGGRWGHWLNPRVPLLKGTLVESQVIAEPELNLVDRGPVGGNVELDLRQDGMVVIGAGDGVVNPAFLLLAVRGPDPGRSVHGLDGEGAGGVPDGADAVGSEPDHCDGGIC
jgi:hypothetical protein